MMIPTYLGVSAALAGILAIFITKPVHREAITSQIKHIPPIGKEELKYNDFVRQTVFFDSHGVRCHAWLYTPTKTTQSKFPVVIMGHGLGAQKDFGLEKYAEVFAKKGLASFLIDYRNFGGSEGEPRNLINPFRHVEDWESAVQFVRSGQLGGQYDELKIGLWGSSMAGGHVLVTAAQQEGISAVVSQIPHLNGRDSSKRNIKKLGVPAVLHRVLFALQDQVRGFFGLSPYQIRIIGHLDEFALMPSSDDEYAAYFAKHPTHRLGNWKNQAPARFMLHLPRYNPEDYLDKVNCKVLFIAAEDDRLCPFQYVERAKEKLGDRGEVLSLKNVGHFAMYSGEPLEIASRRAAEFLVDNLTK
mmetsp:Transcript_19069/g.24623  ORF Transcript_19069/g.24623 Transcript_19069/m.24623 type:complete len:358 (+) Transcript_19069:57-1130(+)